MKATSKRRVAGDEDNVFAYVTTHVNPFMSLTAVDYVEIKMDCVSERNRKKRVITTPSYVKKRLSQ